VLLGFVAAEGFLDDALEGDVVLLGEAAAVFEFGGDVEDAAVDAGKFYADVAEGGGDGDVFAREDTALSLVGANAESSGFGEDEGDHGAGVLRLAEDGEESARAILFHLNRRGVDV